MPKKLTLKKLLGSIIVSTYSNEQIETVPGSCVAEARLDLSADQEKFGKAILKRKGKVLLTFRGMDYSEVKRLVEHADFIDVDLEEKENIETCLKEERKKIIASSHVDFNGMEKAGLQLKNYSRKKLVLKTVNWKQVEKVIGMQDREPGKYFALFCMGAVGRISRITAMLNGMHTYCCTGHSSRTAKGQLTQREMLQIAEDSHGMSYDRKTKLGFVLGTDVSYSLSPRIHNELYKLKGENMVYFRLSVPDNELSSVIESAKMSKIGYCSITIPFKEKAMTMVDRIEKSAEAIGACNTIINRNGKLAAHNTDWKGFLYPLKERINEIERVLVVGGGGAAKAVAYSLQSKGKELYLFNRTPAKATKIARELGCNVASSLEHIIPSADLIVNATPVGMDRKSNPLNGFQETAKKSAIFYDLIYAHDTPMLKQARKSGSTAINGLPMLVAQAAEAYSLYCRKRIEDREIDRIIERIWRETK